MKAKADNLKSFIYPPRFKIDSAQLHHFVSQSSYSFFDILGINDDFLKVDANDWPNNPSYINASNIVKQLTVINDAAERAVALAKEFGKGRTKDEAEQQKLFHSVSEARKKFSVRSKRAYLSNPVSQ